MDVPIGGTAAVPVLVQPEQFTQVASVVRPSAIRLWNQRGKLELQTSAPLALLDDRAYIYAQCSHPWIHTLAHLFPLAHTITDMFINLILITSMCDLNCYLLRIGHVPGMALSKAQTKDGSCDEVHSTSGRCWIDSPGEWSILFIPTLSGARGSSNSCGCLHLPMNVSPDPPYPLCALKWIWKKEELLREKPEKCNTVGWERGMWSLHSSMDIKGDWLTVNKKANHLLVTGPYPTQWDCVWLLKDVMHTLTLLCKES